MPLTKKGREVKENFAQEYGEKKGEEYFYAARNKGTISGVDACDPIRGYLDSVSRGDSAAISTACDRLKGK